MADGFIQVPTDGVGKKVDAEEMIRGDGVTVERQRVAVDLGDVVSLLEQVLAEVRDMKFKLLSQLH